MRFPVVHENWKTLLCHSYVVWLGYALVFLNAFDAGYSYLIGYAPIPQWAMGLISALIGLAIPYVRVIIQNRISGAPKDAVQ